MSLRDFEAWLKREGYARSTIHGTLKGAVRLLDDPHSELPAYTRSVAKRMLAYADAADATWGTEIDAKLQQLTAPVDEGLSRMQKRKRNRTKRQKLAQSYPDGAWKKLYAEVRADKTPAGAVLHVMMATGLRIADVLRLNRQRFTAARTTGRLRLVQKGQGERVLRLDGAPKSWGHLHRAWEGNGAETIAHLVSPGGDGSPLAGAAAYQAVKRRLKKHHRMLKLPGRAHLHRLRRTVGVQALRVTEDIPAVQQLLGHASWKTTMGYLDEARPDDVATLQKKLRDKFTEDDE